MPKYDLKVVPNAEPNADGEWMTDVEVPAGVRIYDFVPRKGHHVVQGSPSRDPQDGGPMHAHFLNTGLPSNY